MELGPVAAAPSDAPLVHVEYDGPSGYSRYYVTTHRGAYAGWVSKPQLTFFALTAGEAPPVRPPEQIALVFRTMEPEAVTGTVLILSCPDRVDTVGVAAASHVAPTGNTQSPFLTYTIPTARVAAFAACTEGSLQVGQMRAPFSPAQLGGIRSLLLHLGAAARSAGT
jgi:hypothetical protein